MCESVEAMDMGGSGEGLMFLGGECLLCLRACNNLCWPELEKTHSRASAASYLPQHLDESCCRLCMNMMGFPSGKNWKPLATFLIR